MTPADEPLLRFQGAPSDKEIAVLTALLLARARSRPPRTAPRPRWQQRYRIPGSWR